MGRVWAGSERCLIHAIYYIAVPFITWRASTTSSQRNIFCRQLDLVSYGELWYNSVSCLKVIAQAVCACQSSHASKATFPELKSAPMPQMAAKRSNLANTFNFQIAVSLFWISHLTFISLAAIFISETFSIQELMKALAAFATVFSQILVVVKRIKLLNYKNLPWDGISLMVSAK